MSLAKEIEKRLEISKNYDLYYREISFSGCLVKVYYLTSIIDEMELNQILQTVSFNQGNLEFSNKSTKVKLSNDIDEIINLILDANVLLITSKNNYLIDLKKYALRSISEPSIEKTIRGSRDGFTESILINTSLIRMRIKSSNLRIESLIVGKESKTQVGLFYLDTVVNKEILDKLRNKIKSLNLDSLIMSDRALEENIFNQNKTIFPLVRYTERPDVASIHIMNGKIIIIVDGSPSTIITPVSLFDHLKHVEEFRLSPIIGMFTKILRFIASLLSVYLIPTMFLMQTNNYQINLYSFYLENEAYFPLSIQYILCSLTIELFRIAIIHTPNTLVTALSIVIGIIFSELSISTHLFMKEVLLVVALATTCTFSIPSYELSLSNKIMMILLLIIASLFKMPGYLIAITIIFVHLVSRNVLGVPFLSPIIPFKRKEFIDKMIRSDASKKKKV